jgi:hypothetical protein
VERIYLYCLAEAAERFSVTVHGWMAMSNHQHLVVRDDLGNLPEFLAHLHKMLAKALNAKWRRWENLWATEQPSVVHLVEAHDRFRKLVYLLVNPVEDDLVEHVADWPGASSLRLNISGRATTITRPRRFFRKDGPMPAAVTLQAERLEGFEHLEQEEWATLVRAAVRDVEQRARARRVLAKRRVLGRKWVLRASPTERPATEAPRRKLRPLLACRDESLRAQQLELVRSFRDAHAASLRQWLGGEREVLFPYGTYRMRHLGARCATSPPSAADLAS